MSSQAETFAFWSDFFRTQERIVVLGERICAQAGVTLGYLTMGANSEGERMFFELDSEDDCKKLAEYLSHAPVWCTRVTGLDIENDSTLGWTLMVDL